jgi:hypothetical protein
MAVVAFAAALLLPSAGRAARSTPAAAPAE